MCGKHMATSAYSMSLQAALLSPLLALPDL